MYIDAYILQKKGQLQFLFVSRNTMDDDTKAIAVGLGAGLGGFVGLVCFYSD
jgi:hypothetical protein